MIVITKFHGTYKVDKILPINRSVSESETLHNNISISPIRLLKNKRFEKVVAKVVMPYHGLSHYPSQQRMTNTNTMTCSDIIVPLACSLCVYNVAYRIVDHHNDCLPIIYVQHVYITNSHLHLLTKFTCF